MISQYETGRTSPRIETLERLAGAVGFRIVVSIESVDASTAAEPGRRHDGQAQAARSLPDASREQDRSLWTM